MKGRIDTVEDDFWTERLPFFTAQFPTYYRKPSRYMVDFIPVRSNMRPCDMK
jgi:hypothetical protein